MGLLCKSGLLSRIVQSRHSVLFVIVSVNKFVTVIVLGEIVGGSRIFIKVSRRFCRQCGIRFVKVFRKPLAAFWNG